MAIELRTFDDVLNARLLAATIPHINGDGAYAWPDVTYLPKKGVPYLEPAISALDRRPLGVGADCVEEWIGTYQISVFVPRDQGKRIGSEIASAVLAAFPRGTSLLTTQGIRVIVTRGTVPVPVPFNDWVNWPVQIDWFAHEP